MATAGRKRAAAKTRAPRARRLAFQPDPDHLVAPLVPDDRHDPGPAILPGPSAAPARRFRVLRPDDLVVLDVLCWDLDLVGGTAGPALVPTGPDARLEVDFPFQHLGERAYFRAEPPAPPTGNEPPDAPPIEALAAHGSRLVYAVPKGERIVYSIPGVLAAMSRLPLLVAPLATPRALSASPGVIVNVATLPGGLVLGRTTEGTLVVTTIAPVKRRTGAVASAPVAELGATLALATSLRTARALLADESAVNLSGRDLTRAPLEPDRGDNVVDRRFGRGFGDLVFDPPDRVRPVRRQPRIPRADETAIEAPFRLFLSPSAQGGFAHSPTAAAAPADPGRVELWHSRLGVRSVDPDDGAVSVDETRHPQRAVRAIWARDRERLAPGAQDAPLGESPFRMSLNPHDRVILVRQTADPTVAPPQPADAKRLYLSSLGAYLDLHGAWNTTPYSVKSLDSILLWDHQAPMGRDQFVQVQYPGYLFPFGHRCALVKITERKVLESGDPQAYLYQRKFLIVGQPVRSFNDLRMPFRQVALQPLVTPDIRDPGAAGTPDAPGGELLFWPVVGSAKFLFTLDCVDHAGRRSRLQAPLLFVAASLPKNAGGLRANDIKNAYQNDPERAIPGNGQSVAYAATTKAGDTSLETAVLRFVGEPGAPGSATSTPSLQEADVVVPAMRHLAPSAPVTTVLYAQRYLDLGFTGPNADSQVFLALKTAATISFSQGTDKAGGFVQPDLPVRGLSRALGAVGDIDRLIDAPPAAKFDPAKFLDGVLPKLFGLFKLTDILPVLGLEGAPSFLTEELDKIAALLSDLGHLKEVVARSGDRLAEDAAGAATTALRDQAEAARAVLDGIRAQLQARVDELVTAIGKLLDLQTPSSVSDVTAKVSGALTALKGVVATLAGAVRDQPLPAPVKAELERLVNALTPVFAAADLIDMITQFVNGIDPAGLAVRARFDWRPKLTNFPDVADDDALFIVRPDGFLLSVEARASGTAGVGVDVLAELRQFALNLFPGAPLLRLAFDRIAFRAASGRKPEVDVVFKGIEFVGILSFIETLKKLIPFDGFSDPPYLDVSASGVVAGFDLALPAVAVGVFALENISLGADARVPFLGDEALTVGFHFCTREKPFRLTVMMIGGGGFVGIRLSPKGLVLLEMSLEAGACLSVNLGVASGSVSVMVGIYLRLEAQAGSLTGYFRIRGEVDVLGLISASITLELSLTYEFATGKMVGRASISIEVEVFFFSFSVSVSCERRLAGSNDDPTFAEQLGVLPDGTSPAWSDYCAAFAGV